MKKRIYIYAYTNLNLGDDLFILMLCNRYPKTKFYLMCNKISSVAFKDISNLTVIPIIPFVDRVFKKVNLSINEKIRHFISDTSDGIVNIGGSIFMESSWSSRIDQYRNRLVNKKPFYIIGSNFGPYQNDEFYKRFKSIFTQVTDICFRDSYSYKLFSDLPNVRYESDVVFAYPGPKDLTKAKQTDEIITISVIDLSNRGELVIHKENYESKIIEMTKYFTDKGFKICLMGFCKYEGDGNAINSIFNQLTENEKKNVSSYVYSGNINEAIGVLKNSKYIIATRFHAMILGWVLGKPVYPIVYSQKSINVINDISHEIPYSKIENLNDFEVSNILDYLINFKPLDIKTQVESAYLQFAKLDGFLKQK